MSESLATLRTAVSELDCFFDHLRCYFSLRFYFTPTLQMILIGARESLLQKSVALKR